MLYVWYDMTFEHIAEMSIINHFRKEPISVTIILNDLKNAFREVHHSLIQTVLAITTYQIKISNSVKT